MGVDGTILHHQESHFFTSIFDEWDSLGVGRIASDWSWTPSLEKNGADTLVLEAHHFDQKVFLNLGSALTIKLGYDQNHGSFLFKDPGNLFVQYQSDVKTYPFAINTHLLPITDNSNGLDFLIDVKNSVKLDYTFGFLYRGNLANKPLKLNRLEVTNSLQDVNDDIVVKELKADSSGQEVMGVMVSRLQTFNFYSEIQRGKNIFSAKLKYAWTSPRPFGGEYGIVDSSQLVELGADWKTLHPRWMGTELGYTYAENSVRTQGIRQPLNSKGSKRFHYALTQSTAQKFFVQSPTWKLFSESFFTAAVSFESLDFLSEPPQFAIDERKETLSYNRLGLSFIADIYGGFSRNAELLHLNGKLNSWEPSLKFQQNILFTKNKWAKIELRIPTSLTSIDFDLADTSESKGLFKTEVNHVYQYRRQGFFLSGTPTMNVSLNCKSLYLGQLKIEGEVSQLVFLWNNIRSPQENPSTNKNGAMNNYSLFANGFFGSLKFSLDI